MKIEFETQHGKFSFVKAELHDGYDYKEGAIRIPNDCKIVGVIQNLTKEQWSEVVDSRYVDFDENSFYQYKDYVNEGRALNTAIESGKSLIDNLEVYTENPYRIDSSYENCNESCLEDVCSCDLIDKWEKAQETVGNWILIKHL